jgi:hypothetical protein
MCSQMAHLVPGASSKSACCHTRTHTPQHKSRSHMTPIRLLKAHSGGRVYGPRPSSCHKRGNYRPCLAVRASKTDAPPRTLAPQWKQKAPKFLGVMFLLGATVGPAVDGIHGQVHLVPTCFLPLSACINTCACMRKPASHGSHLSCHAYFQFSNVLTGTAD